MEKGGVGAENKKNRLRNTDCHPKFFFSHETIQSGSLQNRFKKMMLVFSEIFVFYEYVQKLWG